MTDFEVKIDELIGTADSFDKIRNDLQKISSQANGVIRSTRATVISKICETFTMTYSIKILSKYKLKMLVDIVFDSLFHLMNAAYPELAGKLESYRVDKRRAENKGGKKSAD